MIDGITNGAEDVEETEQVKEKEQLKEKDEEKQQQEQEKEMESEQKLVDLESISVFADRSSNTEQLHSSKGMCVTLHPVLKRRVSRVSWESGTDELRCEVFCFIRKWMMTCSRLFSKFFIFSKWASVTRWDTVHIYLEASPIDPSIRRPPLDVISLSPHFSSDLYEVPELHNLFYKDRFVPCSDFAIVTDDNYVTNDELKFEKTLSNTNVVISVSITIEDLLLLIDESSRRHCTRNRGSSSTRIRWSWKIQRRKEAHPVKIPFLTEEDDRNSSSQDFDSPSKIDMIRTITCSIKKNAERVYVSFTARLAVNLSTHSPSSRLHSTAALYSHGSCVVR